MGRDGGLQMCLAVKHIGDFGAYTRDYMGLYGIIMIKTGKSWDYMGLYGIIWDYMGLYGIIWDYQNL